MKRFAFSGLFASAAMLSGCIYIDAEDAGGYHVSTQFGLEDLRAVNITADTVTIRIDSNGCTSKDKIDVDVDQDGRNEYELAFERVGEDLCRAYFPDGVELSWTYDELEIPEGAYVRVLNDVASKSN